MAIKPIINNIYAGKNLVPKSAYQGPVLKLTKKEQATIKELEAKAAALEIEQVNLRSFIDRSKPTGNAEDLLFEKMQKISYWINDIRKSIHDIKVERYNKQKAKFINS